MRAKSVLIQCKRFPGTGYHTPKVNEFADNGFSFHGLFLASQTPFARTVPNDNRTITPLNLVSCHQVSRTVPFPAPTRSLPVSANFLAKPVRDCQLRIQNARKSWRVRFEQLRVAAIRTHYIYCLRSCGWVWGRRIGQLPALTPGATCATTFAKSAHASPLFSSESFRF